MGRDWEESRSQRGFVYWKRCEVESGGLESCHVLDRYLDVLYGTQDT